MMLWRRSHPLRQARPLTQPPDSALPSLARLLAELPVWAKHPPWFGHLEAAARGRDGGGRAVLVLPGFLGNDAMTARLRHTMDAAGYRAHGWGLGINHGITAELFDSLLRKLDTMPTPLSLVGWSLGGLYARELAKRRPERIDRVITLGSPFSGDLHTNRAWKLYEWINHHPVDELPIPANLAQKPPVATFALWSRDDGIVAPAASRGLEGESDHRIEVRCHHLDFVSAPAAITAVLDALEALTGSAPPPPPAP